MDKLKQVRERHKATATLCKGAVKTHHEDYGYGMGHTTFYVDMGGKLMVVGSATTNEAYEQAKLKADFFANAHDDIEYLLGAIEELKNGEVYHGK